MSRTRRPVANREPNGRTTNGTAKNTAQIVKPKPKPKRKPRQPRPRQPSLELGVGVEPSIETPTQHEKVEYMRDEGAYDDFLILTEAKEFTFENSEEHTKRFGLFSRKLFLGGKIEPRYEVWAYLKMRQEKAREVLVYVATKKPNNVVERMPIEGSSWGEVQLMYPFQVFIGLPNIIARKQLNTLIQYTFLDAREIDRVWMGTAKNNFGLLKSAVRRIAKAYKLFPGGIAAVPDTFQPSDLRGGVVARSPTAPPTISDVTDQTERTTVTPHLDGPNSNAEEPEPEDEPEPQALLSRLKHINMELRKVEEKERKIAEWKRALEREKADVKEQFCAAINRS